MITRKKRTRYRVNAISLAERNGVALNPDDWEQVWAILEKYEEPTYLYAIVDSSTGLVKFGVSKNPGWRIKQLRTGNAGELQLWGFCENASPLTEREVHKRLAADRKAGEWFSLSPEARAVINEIRASAGVSVNWEDRACMNAVASIAQAEIQQRLTRKNSATNASADTC